MKSYAEIKKVMMGSNSVAYPSDSCCATCGTNITNVLSEMTIYGVCCKCKTVKYFKDRVAKNIEF